MRRLGYESYGSHGSDAGAMVSRELGLLNPRASSALHVLQVFSFPSGDPAEFEKLEPKDYAALEHLKWFQSVGGYNAYQRLTPADRRRRHRRLTGRSTRLERAVQIVRQRHEPGAAESDPHRGEPRTGSRTRRRRSAGTTSRRRAPDAEPEVNARTDRRRRVPRRLQDDPRRSPSATTETSCTGASSRRAGTSPPSRFRMRWPATSGCSSAPFAYVRGHGRTRPR